MIERSKVPLIRLWLAVLAGYLALGATIQEMPAFVVHRFGGGPVLSAGAVGIAFLATALGRPFAGAAADNGRARTVVILGGILTALGGIGHLVAPDPAALLASRLVMGAGEAALFSGALPWVLSGADPGQRGRVAGWFGLSMWGGLSVGPVLAALVDPAAGYGGVWWMVTALALFSAALTIATPRQADRPGTAVPWRLAEVMPAGIGLPGMVFGLSAYGYGTVSALAVLYLRSFHGGGQAAALPLFAVAFVTTRFAGSPLVDRVGGVRVAIWSLSVEAAGLLLAGLLRTEPAILIGATLTGAGLALMYPATVAVTLRRIRTPRPGAAVGAVTSSWDMGILAAGPIGGVLAVTAGYRAAFVLAAALGIAAAAIAGTLLRRPVRRAASPDRVEIG
ncbi:MFS transporter [Nocardia sp. NEAU-G5]|uniref:MFS transporter n=1 Tax=Nocardia albiluteola TaxID=2842303 RepID=A0ABS6BAD4_9NOCA|nr:MFS transporter [Nocardia albiluteola]MBU3066370.1 MFS transporter [Nocardia albiluteola]